MGHKQRSGLHKVIDKLWNITEDSKFWANALFTNVDLARCSMLSCINYFILVYLMVSLGVSQL